MIDLSGSRNVFTKAALEKLLGWGLEFERQTINVDGCSLDICPVHGIRTAAFDIRMHESDCGEQEAA